MSGFAWTALSPLTICFSGKSHSQAGLAGFAPIVSTHRVKNISRAALEDSMFAYNANRACNLGHRSYAGVVTVSWSLASHYTG